MAANAQGPIRSPTVLDTPSPFSANRDAHWHMDCSEAPAQIITANSSTDAAALRAKAAELFPEITEDGAPPLWVTEGVGRAFLREDGSYEAPRWRLGSNYCRDVGILADGTARIY